MDHEKKVEASVGRQEASTVRQESSVNRQVESADRRTVLAANRTVFAAERTYAAWVRTALVALASGVGAKATLGNVVPDWVVVSASSLLVLFSIFCFGAAVWREVDTGDAPPNPDVRHLPRFLLIAVNALLGLVSLFALFGVWFGRTGGH